MKRFRERADGDRGAILVELAIVIPLFLALVFGLAEYSITEAGNSAGGNAARDGARVGIINFADADSAGTNHDLIVAAVNSRLAGLVQGTPTVTISCVEADGTTTLATGCDPQHVSIGSDMIKVQVRWTHISPVGIIGSNQTRTDSAVMKIVGAPGTGGGGGGVCTLSSPTANPPTVDLTSQGQGQTLSSPITFTLTVSSADDCGTPQLSLPSESGLPSLVNMHLQTSSTTVYEYVYPTDYTADPNNPSLSQNWSVGPKTAQMQVQGGLKTASANFSVSAPATSCVFGTVTPNPTVNVELQNRGGDYLRNSEEKTITLPVNDRDACATPMLSVSDVTSPLNTAQAMAWDASEGAYTLTIDGNNPAIDHPWSAGTGTITITGPGGASTSVGISVA